MSVFVINDSIAEEYHNDIRLPDGVQSPTFSAGDITIASTESFAAYLAAKQSRGTVASTTAQNIGSAMHNAILADDPEKDGFEIGEFNDYRTKDSKAWKEEVILRGRTPILRKEYDSTIRPMLDSFMESDIAGLIRKPDSKPEQVVYWDDPITKLWQRARIDLMPEKMRYLRGVGQIDYKTAAPKMFKNYIRTFLRDQSGLIRLAHYITAAYHATGCWGNYWLLVQSKEAPYSVKLLMIDVGRALRYVIDTNNGAPLYIGGYEIKWENTCSYPHDPKTGNPPILPSDSELDAIYLAFLYGMEIRAQMLQCFRFCIANNQYPHPDEQAPTGINANEINYSLQNYAMKIDENRIVTPEGFIRDPQGNLQVSPLARLESIPQFPTEPSKGVPSDDTINRHIQATEDAGIGETDTTSGEPSPANRTNRGAPPPPPSSF